MSDAASAPDTAAPRRPLSQRSLVGGLASALWMLGRMGSSVIAARLLGPIQFGQLVYLLVLVETWFLVSGLGLQQATIRYLARRLGRGATTEAAGLAGWLARRWIALIILGEIALQLLRPYLVVNDVRPELWSLVAVWFAVRAMEELARSYLVGTQRFEALARMNGLIGVTAVVGVWLGASYGGLPGAIAGYALSATLPAAFAFGLARVVDSPPGPADARDLWRYALSCWVAALVSVIIWSRLESVALERLAGFAQVAEFNAGLSIANLAISGPLMLGLAMLPHFSERHGARDIGALAAGYATGTRLLAVLVFPFSLGLTVLVPVVLPLLYGEPFRSAIPAAQIIVAGSALQFCTVGANLLYGVGRAGFIAKVTALHAIGWILGMIWLVPELGAVGAALVRVATQLGLVLVGMWFIATRDPKVPVPVGALVRVAVAALLCAVGAHGALELRPEIAGMSPELRDALWLPLPVLAGAVIYVLSLRLLRAIPSEDALALRRVEARLPGPLRPPARWIFAAAGLPETTA